MPPFPQVFDPMRTQRSPLSTIPRHSFLADRPQIFSNGAFVFKIYFFEWGVHAKKNIFVTFFLGIFLGADNLVKIEN